MYVVYTTYQIRAEEFSHTVLHRRGPRYPVGGGGVSAFKPVGGGRLGVVGRPLPPAPRVQPHPIPKLDPPPQPAAPPNRRYNPASVYKVGPKKDSDERCADKIRCSI